MASFRSIVAYGLNKVAWDFPYLPLNNAWHTYTVHNYIK